MCRSVRFLSFSRDFVSGQDLILRYHEKRWTKAFGRKEMVTIKVWVRLGHISHFLHTKPSTLTYDRRALWRRRRRRRGRRCRRRRAGYLCRHGRREQIVCRYAHHAHFLRGIGIVWIDRGAHCESGTVFLWRVRPVNESQRNIIERNDKKEAGSELF